MRREAYIVSAAAIIAASLPLGSAAYGQDAEALAFFNLAESGDGRVSFDSSQRRGNAQVFTGVTFLSEDGEEMQAEELRLTGARQTNDGPVFDSLEIVNLTGSFDEGFDDDASPAPGKGGKGGVVESSSTGTGTLSIDRIVVEQPSPLLAAVIAQAFSLEETDDDADWGKPSDYAFDAIAVEGLSIDTPDGVFTFDTLSFSGFTGETLANFTFSNLVGSGTSEGSDVAFELREFSFNNLDLSGLDALAEVDSEDSEEFEQALFDAGWGDPYKKRYDDYALEGLRIDVDGVLIGLESLAGSAEQNRQVLAMDDRLEALTVEFDDSKDLGAQGLAGLQMLGYDRIEINGRFVQQADGGADRVSSDEYSLTATDALALELDYDIGGIADYIQAAKELGFSSMDAENMDPETMMQLFGPLTVHSFELRLVDDSLVERALQAAADSQGSTPEMMRQQAIAFMTIGTLMAPPGAVQTLVSEAITASTSFLEEPGTLRISINPEQPVSVADLIQAFQSEDYDSALELMNIEVVAE